MNKRPPEDVTDADWQAKCEKAFQYRDALAAIANDSVDPEPSADVRKILADINRCANQALDAS